MRSLFLFILYFSLCYPFKILVYNSKFGHSNINFFGNIADILVEAGHDVTTLLPQIDPTWGDGTTKSKKIYVEQTPECKQMTDILTSENVDWFEADMLHPLAFIMGTPYSDRFALQCKGTLEQTEIIERLKNEKFDVMITENFDMCGIGLSHVIKPKSLINGAASVPLAWMYEEFGLPKSWCYNPSPLISHLDVHSFWSRLKNLYAEASFYKFFYSSRSLIETLFKDKFGPDFPSLTQISSHAAYTIVNSEPLVDFATPTLNRITYVGGLGARDPKKVDKKFDDILKSRAKTILISFGTVVTASQLNEQVKNTIVETVKRFPNVTFIWKYERLDDEFAKKARKEVPNLHLTKWIPQNDLLADRRLTAFITHAGMGSTQELTIRGKPGLFIPILGDQPRNAGMMEHAGVGRVFDKRDLSNCDKFADAVADLYYTNARRIAAMIAKKPFSAREQLIRTVEFAAEFGPSPALRPQSHDMNWIAYHNIDIISILVIFALCPIVLFIKILNRTLIRISSKTKSD
ncbi:hypothetical protein PRIPAC_80964 [Pristionchus pacificus]|uniref:glucuronosyltransferase n=1 Tax=Pristionchus pacificus TaxID=54126 RepID=A0A2A6CQI3_PRIPA|nr:hypothetical protein PRIPAC_80964 [Pristionchus pacificus]|eukprot:PDM80291.1 Glycosyltransferase [Pristionchus pacificus]